MCFSGYNTDDDHYNIHVQATICIVLAKIQMVILTIFHSSNSDTLTNFWKGIQSEPFQNLFPSHSEPIQKTF